MYSSDSSSTDSPPDPTTVRAGREQEGETVQPELLQLPSDIHEVQTDIVNLFVHKGEVI